MESFEPQKRLKFIYEDNHLLVADKPAGLPSQPDDSGDPALDDLAKKYIKTKYAKPGDVYLGLVHRLDRPTSGAVLLARTSKAASRLAEQFRKRAVDKTYFALVSCAAKPAAQTELRTWLTPAGNGGMRPAAGKSPSAREARMAYATVAEAGGHALLRVSLLTGVKHQIRCQLAHAGLPVVGDFRYGAFGRPARPRKVLDGHAVLLHAWRLGLRHPVGKGRLEITAAPPDYWRPFLEAMGGEAVFGTAFQL